MSCTLIKIRVSLGDLTLFEGGGPSEEVWFLRLFFSLVFVVRRDACFYFVSLSSLANFWLFRAQVQCF